MKKQVLKKDIYSIIQLNPNENLFEYHKNNIKQNESDNLNTWLKEYYFNAKNDEILELKSLNESDKCENCNILKCNKHQSILKIDKSYLNLDKQFTSINELITAIKKEVKTVKVSKQIPYDTWFIITNLICLSVITLTFIILYLF